MPNEGPSDFAERNVELLLEERFAGKHPPDLKARILAAAKHEASLGGARHAVQSIPARRPDAAPPATRDQRARSLTLRRIGIFAAAASAVVGLGLIWFADDVPRTRPVTPSPFEAVTPEVPRRNVIPGSDARLSTTARGIELEAGWLVITPGSPVVFDGKSRVETSGGPLLILCGSKPDAARVARIQQELSQQSDSTISTEEIGMIANGSKWIARGSMALCLISGAALIDGDIVRAEEAPANDDSAMFKKLFTELSGGKNHFTLEDCNAWLKKADKNSDGDLSGEEFGEFKAIAMAMFGGGCQTIEVFGPDDDDADEDDDDAEDAEDGAGADDGDAEDSEPGSCPCPCPVPESISLEDAQELAAEAFKYLDRNSDKQVNEEEYNKAVKTFQIMKSGTDAEKAAAMYDMMDRNGDGKLSAEELPDPRMLVMMDTDKDGSVSKAEWDTFVTNMEEKCEVLEEAAEGPEAMKKAAEAMVDMALQMCDANRDGSLDAKELGMVVGMVANAGGPAGAPAALKPEDIIKTYDADKNGMLNRDELIAMVTASMSMGCPGGPGCPPAPGGPGCPPAPPVPGGAPSDR